MITNDATRPAAGDGGPIFFGGNSLTTYNAFDIREGSKIDNADIRYVTRIEMQGGGDITAIDLDGDGKFTNTDNPDAQKAGLLPNLAGGTIDPDRLPPEERAERTDDLQLELLDVPRRRDRRPPR